MKKLMPVVMTSVLVAPFAAQAEGPIDGKVYGKINVAYVSSDDKAATPSTSDSALKNHASRFGFKGKTELEDGLSVVYQLEYEVDPTDANAYDKDKATQNADDKANDTAIFKTRNSYVGIAGAFGTVALGTHDTPFKLAQGKVDQFNDLTGADIKELVRGEVRANDVIAYISPEMSGFSAMAAKTQYEDDAEGTQDATSISVTYKGVENLYVAVAVDSDVAGYDATRFAAQYTMGALTVGALYNESEQANTANSQSKDSTVVSAAYKIDAWTLKAQFASGDEKLGNGGEQMSFGADYKLGKKTKAYIYNSTLENDAKTTDESFTGFGIEHKF